jgi:hypothetical protein
MINATAFIILAITLAQPPVGPLPRGEPPPFSCDPALTVLFTPARPEIGRYVVCTSDRALDGEAELIEALDAFGAAGSYNRAALQRLYGGTRVRVQRSWRASDAEFVSITRLSPYPDATLTRLRPGTMEIRFTIPRRPQG